MKFYKNISDKFTQHPSDIGETYPQHLIHAFSFGISMLRGSLLCFAHGLFPFLFVDNGSKCISKLYERMIINRKKL